MKIIVVLALLTKITTFFMGISDILKLDFLENLSEQLLL